jgi:hypothetical protein
MPITVTPFTDDPICGGHEWTVADIDTLALHVARVAVGQSRHVKKIIEGYSGSLPKATFDTIGNAANLLTATPNNPYHRDGWIFQIMSWIAANKAAPKALIKAPHMIHAHKGFDGLQLEIDEATNKVSAAIIFEDKATTNPRPVIKTEVWPEIAKLESGERGNVLLAETIALLETRPHLDPDSALENILWADARRFRVSVTTDSQYRGAEARQRLFKGYDAVAGGPTVRRTGQIFEIAELRNWMEALANKSIGLLPTIQ